MGKFDDITKRLFKSLNDKNKGSTLEPVEQSIEQPPDEIKLVEHVRSKIDMSRQTNSRIALEGIYLTNVAYLMGFDGVYYDTTYRQFRNVDPKRKLGRNRFRVNKILPQSQNRLSRITKSSPKYDVRPNSNTTGDKDASRLGAQIIENALEKALFDEKRQEVCMATMQGGIGYIQVLWDPTLGKPMIDPESGKLMGYEGDIRLEVLNCLEVFPDPLAKTVDEAQWLIKAKIRKLEYFRDRYPDRGQAVKEENTWLMSAVYDLKTNALTSVGIAGAQTADQQRDSAIELTYYEKRSKDYPNGRMVVCANGVLLEDKELPIGEYDIVKFDDILIGGRYHSESVITHARPIQDQYNITRTKCADWIRKLMAGKIIAAKGANISQEAWNDQSGEWISYVPVPNAAEPHAMNIPQIPSYVYKDLDTLDKELDYIFGINEVSRGILPSSSIPASGMAFLQEQDETRIGVITTRNENAYARIGCAILRYVGKYYEMPRMLKIAGDGLEYAVKEFKGEDLLDNYDVIVIPGSTVPSSKILKRQDILNAYQMGILGNPMDDKLKMKVLKMLEYGDVAEMWKTQALTEVRIKKEIESIEKGQKPDLNEFDNHDLFLLGLNDYRMSDKFDNLDDAKKGMFIWVMNWHLQAKVNIANPQIPQQQMLAEAMAKHQPQVFQEQNQQLQQHPGAPPAAPTQGQVPGGM